MFLSRSGLLLFCLFPAGLSAITPASSASSPAVEKVTTLPVRRVVLYKNGVGYFEHAGHIVGNGQVSIDFTTSQLNDVLQSLTALDRNGGFISGVNYNSTAPFDEQLKSISLSLGADPSSTDLFSALRGARIEVSGLAGGPITGHLLNIEIRADQKTNDTTVEHHYLTVIAEGGAIRVIELTPAVSVHLLDAFLHEQLNRYLSLVATTRNQDLRHLTLSAHGSGPRELRVSYISEVPVWKSTYRIVFPREEEKKTGDASAILQGWAVVDNTVGSDWENVQLSLVAGAPQSFIQALSQPFYLRRPEIGLPATAMTTPQTHEAAEKPLSQVALNGLVAAPAAAARRMGSASESVTVQGIGGGAAGGVFAGGLAGPPPLPPPSDGGVYRPSDALKEGDVSTNSFDDYFEYALAQPITIHKNESALVPILQTNVEAERVTLWNFKQARPLRALWMTNSSKFTLDRGSFSIFEEGEFAGEGLLDPIHPGEKRLLSYAVDQATQVSTEGRLQRQNLQQVSIANGVLIEKNLQVNEVTYKVSNAASDPRTVVIEHERHPGMNLDSNPAPEETTPTLYRFRIVVGPQQTVRFHVGERGVLSTRYLLKQGESLNTQLLINLSHDHPGLTEQLTPIVDVQRRVAELDRQLQAFDEQIKSITDDEARARDNITALKGQGSSDARRFIDQLQRDEDELQAARKQSDGLHQQRNATQEKLINLISSFQLDTEIATNSDRKKE